MSPSSSRSSSTPLVGITLLGGVLSISTAAVFIKLCDDAPASVIAAARMGIAAIVLLPIALVVTLYIFMRGHNQPGGGFIAGLITAVTLVMQYMATGQSRAEALLRAEGGRRFVRWIGIGLGLAGLPGGGSFFFGQPFLTSAHGNPDIPLLGSLPLATAALFDLGVYITVVGATLLTLSTLGAVTRETALATDLKEKQS